MIQEPDRAGRPRCRVRCDRTFAQSIVCPQLWSMAAEVDIASARQRGVP